MPKIELSAAKGLVQKTGHGFIDADFQTDSGAVDLTAATTSSAARGALVHLVTQGGNVIFKLHGKEEGATAGQVKIIVALDGNNLTIQNRAGGGVTPATVLTNAGDLAICIFNGTTWIVGNSIG